jgi:hypothetical protein
VLALSHDIDSTLETEGTLYLLQLFHCQWVMQFSELGILEILGVCAHNIGLVVSGRGIILSPSPRTPPSTLTTLTETISEPIAEVWAKAIPTFSASITHNDWKKQYPRDSSHRNYEGDFVDAAGHSWWEAIRILLAACIFIYTVLFIRATTTDTALRINCRNSCEWLVAARPLAEHDRISGVTVNLQ